MPPRPCLSINKITEKIDQIEGEFRELRPSFKVRPVDSKADPKIADIISGLIRHIEYDSQARTAYNTAHTSVLYCGRGAWRIDIEDDQDDPFVRSIKVNRIANVFSVYMDPECKKQDKSDARYCFVTEIVPKKEFEAKYGDDYGDWPSEDAWREWRTDSGYRVAEYWWRERVDKTSLS